MQTVVTNALNNKTKVETSVSSLDVLKTTSTKTKIEYFSGSITVENLGSALSGKTTSVVLESSKNTTITAVNLTGKTSIGPVVNLTVINSEGSSTIQGEAAEFIPAGTFVYLLSDGRYGVAAPTRDKPAIGYTTLGALTGGTLSIHLGGSNDNLSGLTAGSRYYLGVNGLPTAVPPSGKGKILQYLGRATSATSLKVEISDYIVRG